MSVQTAARGVIDNYDVRGTHDLFRATFPKVERHEPVALVSEGGLQELGPDDAFYRWWFTTEDGELLVQLQEDLVARNWRRRQLPPAMPHPYPGYEKMRDGFREQVDLLRSARGSDTFPNPAHCELLYDNFLTLITPEGEQLRVQEVFKPVNFPEGTSRAALTMQWVEPLTEAGEGAAIRVLATVHGVSIDESPSVPVVRLNFSARRAVDDWEDVFTFFDVSHEVVRQRFIELTTDRCHTIWGLK